MCYDDDVDVRDNGYFGCCERLKRTIRTFNMSSRVVRNIKSSRLLRSLGTRSSNYYLE